MASRGRDKPGLSLENNTAEMREREDANRTRAAGRRDELEGVAAGTLTLNPKRGRWLHRLVRRRRCAIPTKY
jgi:hypothetical protein